MPGHRTFDTREVGEDDKGPTFDLAGRKLVCLPVLPVAAQQLLRREGLPIRELVAFVEATLTDSSVVLFRDALADKTQIVDEDLLADVVMWLTEEYAQRPSVPPSDSSDGRPTTTDTSMGA